MKLASVKNNTKDGQLILVSQDNANYVDASDIAINMQTAIENWDAIESDLKVRYQALNKADCSNIKATADAELLAPLPRAWQWLDGSLFLRHGELMQKAFNIDPIADTDKIPLIYQGAGDNFSGPNDPIVAASEQDGIDFEGEFGVIVGDIPMGSSPDFALEQIKLLVMLNDISFRALAPREMKTGFGFLQSKGATAFAPFAITPDELGANWIDGRIHLPLTLHRSGNWFGSPSGSEMHFGFHELIAHSARTRSLNAGTILGSGTVSNTSLDVGQACLSELRAKEMIQEGKPITQFLSSGESVHMRTTDTNGKNLFGDINQTVVVEN